jgi:RNA recognition motif-containing protein
MTSIFVAKLDFGVTNQELRQLFEAYGTVLKATIATDRETGKPRGFAFVEMADQQEALAAINGLDGYVINGRALAVKEAEQRSNDRPAPRPAPAAGTSEAPSRSEHFRPPVEPSAEIGTTGFISPKLEPRKKSKDKDRKPGDDENRNKKPKMDAYKKSGKSSRFFDDDDDDFDDDLFNYKKSDEDEDFFDDDDDDEI